MDQGLNVHCAVGERSVCPLSFCVSVLSGFPAGTCDRYAILHAIETFVVNNGL